MRYQEFKDQLQKALTTASLFGQRIGNPNETIDLESFFNSWHYRQSDHRVNRPIASVFPVLSIQVCEKGNGGTIRCIDTCEYLPPPVF